MTLPRVRWGLIGCGDIARKRVAPALRDVPESELVAVARARSDQAESFAREFGVPRWYTTAEELVADKEIDAVYIATPVHLHASQAIAAAHAGKHVLCEKPMAMTVGECEQMMTACDDRGVRLGVAYYRHFYPVVVRLKEILASGEIGTPVIVQINAFEYFDPAPENPRRWLLERELSGGGPMFDFGCHRIEVLINLLGDIRRVSSVVSNTIFNRSVEDTATAVFAFENGAQGVLSVTHAAAEAQDTLSIFGSRGSVHVPALNNGTLIVRRGAQERHESHPAHVNLHFPLIEDFVQAVITNRDARVNGPTGREVARIAAEIYRAGSPAHCVDHATA
jgi:predicted dehydrogenase